MVSPIRIALFIVQEALLTRPITDIATSEDVDLRVFFCTSLVQRRMADV